MERKSNFKIPHPYKYAVLASGTNKENNIFGATRNDLCDFNIQHIPGFNQLIAKANPEQKLLMFTFEDYAVIYLNSDKVKLMYFVHHSADINNELFKILIPGYENQLKLILQKVRENYKGKNFESVHFYLVPTGVDIDFFLSKIK